MQALSSRDNNNGSFDGMAEVAYDSKENPYAVVTGPEAAIQQPSDPAYESLDNFKPLREVVTAENGDRFMVGHAPGSTESPYDVVTFSDNSRHPAVLLAAGDVCRRAGSCSYKVIVDDLGVRDHIENIQANQIGAVGDGKTYSLRHFVIVDGYLTEVHYSSGGIPVGQRYPRATTVYAAVRGFDQPEEYTIHIPEHLRGEVRSILVSDLGRIIQLGRQFDPNVSTYEGITLLNSDPPLDTRNAAVFEEEIFQSADDWLDGHRGYGLEVNPDATAEDRNLLRIPSGESLPDLRAYQQASEAALNYEVTPDGPLKLVEGTEGTVGVVYQTEHLADGASHGQAERFVSAIQDYLLDVRKGGTGAALNNHIRDIDTESVARPASLQSFGQCGTTQPASAGTAESSAGYGVSRAAGDQKQTGW